MGKRIREHVTQRVPYILVVGDKEIEAGGVAVRGRGEVDLGTISVEEFKSKLSDEIATKQ